MSTYWLFACPLMAIYIALIFVGTQREWLETNQDHNIALSLYFYVISILVFASLAYDAGVGT